MSCYRHAVTERRAYPEAWNEPANALNEEGAHRGAPEALRQAESLAPDFEDTVYNLACTYALEGNLDNALVELQRAVRTDLKY